MPSLLHLAFAAVQRDSLFLQVIYRPETGTVARETKPHLVGRRSKRKVRHAELPKMQSAREMSSGRRQPRLEFHHLTTRRPAPARRKVLPAIRRLATPP